MNKRYCIRRAGMFALLGFFWLAGQVQASAQGKTTLRVEEPARSSQLDWLTDAKKAQELSRKTKKPIFAFFTGSDWCGWCHKLQADVFSKPEFVAWAKKNVILLELDFPRRKQLTPELAQQNNGLQQAFQVQGYPTIWIFYMEKEAGQERFNIMPLGSLGYPRGAEQGREQLKFLAEANSIMAKKEEVLKTAKAKS